MDKKDEVIEMLRCALINCDNIRALGSMGIDIVKMQVQSAIDMIEGKEEE